MAETRRTTRVPKATKTKPVDEYGHLQPQAPELEEAVLGALMIEKDAYSLVSEILRPESFYEHRNQLIYAAITDLAIQQKPIDILTVTEQLRSRGDLDEVGGPFTSPSSVVRWRLLPTSNTMPASSPRSFWHAS